MDVVKREKLGVEGVPGGLCLYSSASPEGAGGEIAR